MKNTRRFISAVMALAMVSAIAPMSAFAATESTIINQETALPTTKDINVSFENAPTYTVTIPADVNFTSATATPENEVAVSDVYLDKGKSVKVTVASANDYKMILGGTDAGTFVPYSLTSDKSDVAGEIITVASGTLNTKGSGTAKLTYEITDKNIPAAGSYSDKLTFTISIV